MRDDDPNSGGLSRKTIDQELENSLDRLRMDTVDRYQIHRQDPETPIEGTLGALDDAVRRGKTRYLGASSMWAHQFADALHASDRLGFERFACSASANWWAHTELAPKYRVFPRRTASSSAPRVPSIGVSGSCRWI